MRGFCILYDRLSKTTYIYYSNSLDSTIFKIVNIVII